MKKKTLKEIQKKDLKELNDEEIEQIRQMQSEPEKCPEEVLTKFKDSKLLENIKEELNKDHLEDDNLKLTTFLNAVSGLLKNHHQRNSQAITSDSSVGKDNLIKAVLKHMPTGTAIFLTNATQSVLEDDIKNIRIVAYSEMNKDRELGANKHLVEAIKQMAEGGMSALKKDIRANMKIARFSETEQKSVLYGTTEEARDPELETRFLVTGMKYTYDRGKKVNENTLEKFSDIDKLLQLSDEEDSWIKKGLNYFYYQKEPYDEIWIPYAELLKEIDGQPVFNYDDPRSQRDIKRLLNLTSAMTWAHQEQRISFKTKEGLHILISEPQDFIKVVEISQEFFDETYAGIDSRLLEILEIMRSYAITDLKGVEDEKWIPRDWIEEKAGKAKNTIKARMNILSGMGLVEGIKGKDFNKGLEEKGWNDNKIYYKRCQKGIKKVLIRCQLEKLKGKLSEFSTDTLTPFCYAFDTLNFTNQPSFEKTSSNQTQNGKGVKSLQVCTSNTKSDQFDTFRLTPFQISERERTIKRFFYDNKNVKDKGVFEDGKQEA